MTYVAIATSQDNVTLSASGETAEKAVEALRMLARSQREIITGMAEVVAVDDPLLELPAPEPEPAEAESEGE